jgi:thiopurine S-methyltransferase
LNVIPHITKQGGFVKYQYENVELLCGDFFSLEKTDLPNIQAVYDCKALIALPPDMRKKYLSQMINCLGTKIKILLLTRESNCEVSPPPFPIDEAEVNSLYGSYFNVKKLKCVGIKNIPEKLVKKGYTEITESVYLISEKESEESQS